MGLAWPPTVVAVGLILLAAVEAIPRSRLRSLLSEELQFEARMNRSGIADEAAAIAFEGGTKKQKKKLVLKVGPEALTCIAHTGLTCTPNHITEVDGTTRLVDRCSALTSGPAACVQSKCECAEGFCSDSHGQCSPERSVLLPEIFRINPEHHPTSFLKMGETPGGQLVLQVSADDGDTPHTQWRVVQRTDGTHLLTTMAYPNHVIRFVEECEATNLKGGIVCHHRVEVAEMWEASTVGTEIKKFGLSSKLVLVDIHTSVALYFDLKLYNYGLGCYLYGSDCPHETSFLTFDPPLPDAVLAELYSVESVSKLTILAYIGGSISALLFCCICWKECFLNVKGTRFGGAAVVTRSGS